MVPTTRLLSPSDFQFIYNLLNSDPWLKFIGNRNITDINKAKDYIQNILENPWIDYYVIELPSSNIAIGIITLIKRDYLPCKDFGFAMLPEFEGHGYAYNASRNFLDSILENELCAITKSNNCRSIKLLEKLNFKISHDFINENEVLSYYHLKMP